MSKSYPSVSLLIQGSGVIGASVSNQELAKYVVSNEGSRNVVIGVKASSVTVGAGITVGLQTSVKGDDASAWNTAKTASITADGWVFIRLNVEVAGDQSVLPLASAARIVITTGAGSAATITNIQLCQAV